MKPKNYYKLTPEDFPPGEPALKHKRGLWYRSNNRGYTDRIAEAGLYSREDIIQDCFEGSKNGHCDVLGVPLRMALDGYTTANLKEKIANIERMMPYAKVSDEDEMTVF